MDSHRIHPKTCTPVELFGWFSNDGYSTWNDGILTKFLRYVLPLIVSELIGALRSTLYYVSSKENKEIKHPPKMYSGNL